MAKTTRDKERSSVCEKTTSVGSESGPKGLIPAQEQPLGNIKELKPSR